MITTYIIGGAVLIILVIAFIVQAIRPTPEQNRITLSDEWIAKILSGGFQGLTASEFMSNLESDYGLGRPRMDIMAENLGADMSEVAVMTDSELLELLSVLVKTDVDRYPLKGKTHG